jgi:hypothetical protein
MMFNTSSFHITLVCLALALAKTTAWLVKLGLRSYSSRLKYVPCPDQGVFLFRLWYEPNAAEIERWLNEVPHNGLLRYHGFYNEERIFVAGPEAVKDFLVTGAYKFVKPVAQRTMIANVGGPYGLLALE